jgi:hypothetical protein
MTLFEVIPVCWPLFPANHRLTKISEDLRLKRMMLIIKSGEVMREGGPQEISVLHIACMNYEYNRALLS